MIKGNSHLKTNNTESDRVRRKRYRDYKMVGDKGTVCVTGGTGYIGSWLIKVLLEQGYAVHTTIRPDPDLSDPETFGAAIEGCKGVLHVVSPMDFQDNEPEAVVTKRAIDGALGILKTCLRSKTVKRVVFTSSIASVYFNNKDVDMMDETEHGLDLLTVIPPLVVGPFICPKLTGSVRAALAPILGNKDDYSLLLNTAIVRVDDLSRAFIFLLEHPEAKGRYNCSSDTVTIQKIVEILSANDPEFPLPIADSLEEIEGTKMPGLSSKKLLDLGFKFKYGIEDMYDGAYFFAWDRI
ncbi:NAD-dependent epimerase/dehydratase - like 6 [Theobroma cacao]|nr:NAD-dependent epimerase/dehydratase - like 6 [Theobroma cacao]